MLSALWPLLLVSAAAKRSPDPPVHSLSPQDGGQTEPLQLPASWECPSGWELLETETRRGVDLPARLSRLFAADSEDHCLAACEDDPECLEGTYDEASGECGVLVLSAVNSAAFCGAVRARREGIPLQLLATLQCSKGCVAIQKVCQSCEKQSLRQVMAAALCTDLFEHSPSVFCSGGPQSPAPGSSGLDEHPNCCLWAGQNECDRNPFFMKVRCSASCGTSSCQVKTSRSCKVRVRADCRSADTAPDADDTAPEKSPDPKCPDRHQLCSFWAWAGECEQNPVYMRRNCRFSCRLCP